jgi:UDP-2,4-diacetamido-2,4,6-trideoxy-beta-L-altropyranose hydrolase
MSNRIIFRADGDAQIGMGHVMRCLALADMLGESFDRSLAIVQPVPVVQELITAKGITLISLKTDDLAELLILIKDTDVVVLDGYNFDEQYQRTLSQQAHKLVYIDDLVQGQQVANVVINHAGGITEYDYRAETYTQFFLGPHYAMLRPVFFQPASPVPAEGTIFVNLGGADPHNRSAWVLDALRLAFRQMGQQWRVHLVLGPFHPNRANLDAYRDHLKHLTILSNLTAEQMVGELQKCQLAITACSTISYEVCAIHRPLIGIKTADNQQYLANFLQKEQVAQAVFSPQADLVSLANTIQLALERNKESSTVLARQKHYFDSRSPERFRTIINRLMN